VNINENIHTPTLTFKQGRFIAEIPNNITDEERTSNLKPLKKFIERKKEVDYLLYVDDQLLFITIRI
jgi:hypothetical protein